MQWIRAGRCRPAASEAGAAGEAEGLQTVAAVTDAGDRIARALILAKGIGIVKPDRPERRLPEQARADRGADDVLVANAGHVALELGRARDIELPRLRPARAKPVRRRNRAGD